MRSESYLRHRAAGSGYGKRRNRAAAAGNKRNRSLQIEQCENRMLLSISPTALQLTSISPYETSILGTPAPTNVPLIWSAAGISNTVRTEAPSELVLDFNQGQNIDPATLGGIQVFRSGGDNQFQTIYNAAANSYSTNPLNTAMDVVVPIGSATINQTLNTTNNQLSSNEVVIRFSQDLPADLYQIVILGKANSPLDDRPTAAQLPLAATSTASSSDQPFDGGQDQVIDFSLQLGAHVTSVVPQPITRNANGSLAQARNEVDVYFDQQLNQASAQDPSFYQLIVTGNSADSSDDIVVASSHYTVQYSWNAVTGISESRLIFDADLSTYDPNLASEGGASAFRLLVGTQYHAFSTNAKTAVRSPDETFVGADANSLGVVQNATDPLGGETWVINGAIEPQSYALEWPGGTDTPGNRDLPTSVGVDGESHFDGLTPPDLGPTGNIPTYLYNFADEYNIHKPSEHNEITAAQEQLVRDIFQLYGTYLGVKFQETYSPAAVPGEITVATGDLDAMGGTSGGGVIGMGGENPYNFAPEAVMDGAQNWGTNAYGGYWFGVAIHEIGHVLGYGHDDETPELSMMNVSQDPTVNLTTAENILPSPQDIATGLNMFRTDSSAIDLYQFQLPTSGTLSLETIAQRMQNSSTLNTNLILYNSYYDAQGNLQHAVIARNDDYFGTDSYINLVNLPAGTYYVGVSASGNDNYNPNVPLSGMNGTSQGPYELRIGFAPSPAAPAAVLTDGNISLDNSPSVPVTFKAGTAPFTASTDSGHPVISNITTISNLDGKTFQITKGTNTYTFEFVDTSNPSRQAAAGHLALSFNSQTDSLSAIQEDIAAGINNAVSNLVDTTATPLDGDYDGTPGGQYDFWFNVQDMNHTIYVDKVASAAPTSGALGTITNPYTTVQAALAAAPGPAVLQTDGNIRMDNSATAFTYVQSTSPFPAGFDAAVHPAIVGINLANLPGATTLSQQARMALLNGLLFQVKRTSTGVVTTFEFVDDSQGGSAAAGHQAVYYNSAFDNPTSLQTIIANAINGTVQPGEIVRIVGNVGANFANDSTYPTYNNGNTIVAVAANQGPNVPLINDGVTFTISDGLQTTTFEFERNAANLTPGDVLVPISSSDTAAQVAQDIVNAINSVSVNTLVGGLYPANGLHATATTVLDPVTGVKDMVSVTGPAVGVNLGALVQDDPLKTALQSDVPYAIGTDPLGTVLSDGATMSVPKGVSVMIDSGAVFKLMAANIDVGSSAVNIDRSLGAIQVLGTPSEDVYFTSWNDERVGSAYYANSQGPSSGDWGGLVFRNDYDYQEQVADPTRRIMEQQGIFLDYVNHADMTYGGGQVTVNGITDYYDPIYLIQARPNISYNTITNSRHAAVSADPNSFQETLFHDTFGESMFTADYDRAGPTIYGNLFTNDSYNGVFIRVTTNAGTSQEQLTADARLTSIDAVYILAETLEIAGNPGGPVDNIDSKGNPVGLGDTATTNLTSADDNLLQVPAAGTIQDRESFVLSDRYRAIHFEFTLGEGAATGSDEIKIGAVVNGVITYFPATTVAANIAAAINDSGLKIVATATGSNIKLAGPIVAVEGLTEVEARLGGRLDIDPGVIMKLSASRIETEMGGEFLAEGTIGRPIVFTSLLDQNYGAGGTFDTANENSTANPQQAAAGNWSGLYFSPTSFGSLDYTRVYYAGGTSAIEGSFASFAPVEIRQAQVRITNSVFENNMSTADPGDDRNGRGDLPDATVIQIRGAQPILVNDVILNNPTADAISTDCNSLDSFQVQDWGRSTGQADIFTQYADNVGPMIRQIKMSNNAINGLVIRPGTMVTEGIWDDTDIVHVVEGTIVVPNVTIYGGLRLQSTTQESLVVKFLTVDPTDPAEILATGTPEEIEGRIGGSLQVLGTPGHPVVLTSLYDQTAGAGFDPWGNPQFDTDPQDPTAVPKAGDWNSLILDTYSNDYNVAEINEYEPAYGTSDINGTTSTAQFLGQLAQSPQGGDDTLRLGFEVHGAISYSNPGDQDVYSFQGFAGTQVWLDIDRTTYALDSQIDLLDANGNVLATAYASIDPATGDEIAPQFVATGQFAAPMDADLSAPVAGTNTWASPSDPWYVNNMYSTNPNDAAMRVILPGPSGQQRTYYVRVSSHSGKSSGNYELQIRLQSTRVTPGSVVQYADIRYATNGVEVLGKPDHSPLEVQSVDYAPAVTTSATGAPSNVQPVGNLLASDENTLNVGGYLNSYQDVNWYSFTLDYNFQTGGNTVEIPSESRFPVVFDISYASGLARPDTELWIFDSTGKLILTSDGTGSDIADQQAEPLQGANSGNLVHASYGLGDAYIGPVYLPADAGAGTGNPSGDGTGTANSTVYYVAVTTLGASANSASGPLVRFEPVDSVNEIADDNIGEQNANELNQAPPVVLFPGSTPAQLNTAAQPFNLGDVALYVLTQNRLYTADPFTGAVETQVTEALAALPYTNNNSNPSGNPPYVTYGDLAMRNDGQLYAVTYGPQAGIVDQSQWSGTYVQLDTGDASNAPLSVQNDGIVTYVENAGGLVEAGLPNPSNPPGPVGGINVNATAFGPGNLNRPLYLIGNDPANVTPSTDPTAANGAPFFGGPYGTQNLLYELDENGNALSPIGSGNQVPNPPRLPTNVIPLAQLHSGSAIQLPATGASALNNNNDVIGVGNDILDGTQFTVTDTETPAKTVTFEFDSGPDIDLGTYGAQGVRDGQQFTLSDGTTTKTFEFDSGPVLIFHNDANRSLDQATFSVTDDKGATKFFEFIDQPADNPPATLIPGYTEIDIPANSTAQTVANLAIAAINNAGTDVKSALGEFGDATDQVDPKAGSTWARVSLIQDSLTNSPTGDGNLIQVQGSYGVTPGTIPIEFKETYDDPVFQAIETAAPATPVSATDLAEGFPWPSQPVVTPAGTTLVAYFGAQIQHIVETNMPDIQVGFSARTPLVDARINFYGATNTNAGDANFGQASALIHDATQANADFLISSVDVGAKYNNVQVVIKSLGDVTGNNAKVTFTPGAGGVGGTLTIDINAGTTTAITVVNAINAAQVLGTVPFAATLDSYLELSGTNAGSGILDLTGTVAVTSGGFDHGILTWADTTGDTNQVEDRVSPWGQTWTWRAGADHTNDPSPTSANAPLSGAKQQYQASNHELIPFGAGDNALTIAQDIVASITKAQTDYTGFTVTAAVDGSEVDLSNASTTVLPSADAPFTVPNAAGPGGSMTGMAVLNNETVNGQPVGSQMFSVSDKGGFYWIKNYNSPSFYELPNLNVNPQQTYTPNDIQPIPNGASAVYLGTIPVANGSTGAVFEGLTAGPPDVENGAYANTLFAISSTGVMYALSVQLNSLGIPIGVVQDPIFLNGGTSISTGLTNVTGLAFTTLDYNLWHVTNQQGTVAGHGTNPTYDSLRVANVNTQAGGTSFYFGLENPTAPTTISNQPGAMNYYYTNPAVYNTYNLPDGAAGSLDTQTFDLTNYTAADAPTLYFNYYLNKSGPTDIPHDTARVYASNDGANWTELADLADSNGSWLQGKYSLAAFAGDATVRVRFDFSTAGDMEIGDANGPANAGPNVKDVLGNLTEGASSAMFSGAYMTALSGELINDGDTFIADGHTFEFDMGEALFLPNVAGNVIQNGETFTIPTGTASSTTFQFVLGPAGIVTAGDVAIPYIVGETTDQVAQEIVKIVNAQNLTNSRGATILADAYQNRVMLNYAEGLTLSAASTLNTAALLPANLNQNGANKVGKNSVPVLITSTMSADQVAIAIATAMDQRFSAGRTLQAVSAIPAIIDGESFSLQDNAGKTVKFVFNQAGGLNTATTSYIQYNPTTDTATLLAAKIAAAINGSGLATTATVNGSTITLTNVFAFTNGASPITYNPVNRTLNVVSALGGVNAGDTFTLTDNSMKPVSFVFDPAGTVLPAGEVLVPYTAADSATTIATSIATAINGSGINITATVNGSTVVLAGSLVLFDPGTSRIQLSGAQTDTKTTLAANAVAGQFTNMKVVGSLLHVIGHTVTDAVSHTTGGTATLPISDFLNGDLPYSPNPPYNYDRFQGTANNGASRERGQQNDAQGWYVDDVQIGFAERGQMVTDSAPNSTFTFTKPPVGIVTQGYYQLQIRRGPNWAEWPVTPPKPPLMVPLTSFDVNDRMANAISMTIPAAIDISDHETFTISDGVHAVTFEYSGDGTVIYPNDQPIYFTSDQTQAQVAADTAAAINLANTRGLFTVEATAGGVDNTAAGDKIDEGGVYLFQAAYVTTSWTAPTVPAGLPAAKTEQNVQYVNQGDTTIVMDQGEDIIEEDSITNSAQYGIMVAAVQPTSGTNAPQPAPLGDDPSSHPYSVGPLRVANTSRLVPGITIVNNLLAYGGLGGIDFSGDASVAGETQAAVPFGHIVNNTIYGGGAPASATAIGSAFTQLTGTTGSTNPGTTTVYRFDLGTSGLSTVTSLTIADNSGGLAGGPTGQYSGLDLDGILVSNTLAASAAAAAGLTGLNVFNFNTGVALVPGTQNAPVAPNLFGTNTNNTLNNAVATLQAFDASGPTSATPAGFVALGVGGTITFNLTSPITVVPGTYLYIAVSEDLGQFAAAKITANGQTANTGTGILVQDNASPTILNNIVASLSTGIQIVAPAGDASNTTVVGYSVYQNDATNNNLAANGMAADTDAIYATPAQQLFVNPAVGNFYPAQFSPVIDSSVNQLDDRPAMVNVRQPLGIPSSPILAPQTDLFGQLRIADKQVSPYPGLGSNVYIDRGAIDRVDFVGPTTALTTPQDNDAGGLDIDPRPTWVTTTQLETQFTVQLSDSGSGVDNSTVTTNNVVLTEDLDNNPADIITLVQGTDYFFKYDSNNHVIHLIPAAGVWAEGYTYNILLTTAIEDLAGNALQPNRLDHTNQFTIVLAGVNGSNTVPAAGIDFSHAPNYPVAWQVEPSNPIVYLGKIPPIEQPAFVASATRADNDGISSASIIAAQGTTVTIPVTVSNLGTTTAYLNAWVDFRADGSFADAGDQVGAVDMPVAPSATPTIVPITVTVPTGLNAAAFTTWIRLRVSTQQGLSSTGGMPLSDTVGVAVAEPDGEVEDFNNVIIVPPPVTISGAVYNDYNGNGTQDAGEPPLGNWTVFLDTKGTSVYDPSDPHTVSDPITGQYTLSVNFANVSPGTYNLLEQPQNGYTTTQPAGGSYSLVIASGLNYSSKNFGDHYTSPPTVTSIVKLDADPTNATTVHYAVNFIDPVTGVVASDFIVAATPTTSFPSSSIAVPTPIGTPFIVNNVTYASSWTVAVATGPGTVGTFELQLNDSAHNIHDSSGQTLATSTYVQPNQGAVYHIDQVAPTVVSIVMADAEIQGATNAQFVHFTVTFSKGVIGLNRYSPNFALATVTSSGLTNTQITSVAVASTDYTKYTVTVLTGTGSGTLGLNLADPKQTIKDAVGNTLTGTGSSGTVVVGPTYTIDRVSPVASISLAAGQASPTSTSPIHFKVVFSKSVTGFTSAGVDLSSSSLPNLTATVTGSGTTYDVAVTGMTGSGTVVARIMSNVAQDYLGNLSVASGTATVTFTSTPTVTVAQAATQLNPINVGPIHFTVTFNQPVVDFTAAKLSFTGSTAPGTLVGTITGSGPVYDVAVTGMTATGRVQLNIAANTVHNSSGTGNNASTGTTNFVFYDIDAPVASLVNPTNGASLTDTAINSLGYIDIGYSAQVGVGINTPTITAAGPQFTFSGTAAAGVTVNGFGISLGADEFRYLLTGSFGAGTVTLNFIPGSYKDNAGNPNKAQSLSFNVFRGISVSDVTVARPATGSVNAVFTVSLSGPSSVPVTVHYATANGTNTVAGTDYTAESGSVTFAISQTTKTVSVPVLASSSTTTPKTFLLNLSAPSNAIIARSSATCTITNANGSPATAKVLSAPAAVAASPKLPNSLVAAIAATLTSSNSDSNNKHATSAVDAVFATMMSAESE